MTDYRKNGGAVGGGGGMTNPMTTVGDTIVGGVAGAPDRLAAGSAGYILRVVGGTPAWRELFVAGTSRPGAAATREGQWYWSTDAAAGLELAVCTHQGGTTYAWATVPYGVTATGSALVQAADAAAARAAVLAAYDPGARAIDANHVYVWRCNDAAGAGSIAEASSGPALALTGSTWTQGDLALYRGGNAALLRPDAAVGDRAVSASTLTAPTGNVTLEVDFMSSALRAITGGASLTHLVVFSNAAISKYVVIRLSASGGQVHAACASGGAETTTSLSALPLASVLTSQPHHFMAVMIPGTSLALYFDGQLVSSVALGAGGLTGTDSFTSIGLSSNTAAPVGWLGEVRVSNVARDAAYARAAYSTLRSRA